METRINMSFGLVMTCYNRPGLTKQSLDSLSQSIWPEFDRAKIIIIDDKSGDEESLRVIAEWSPRLPANYVVQKICHRKNMNMYASLREGFDILYNENYDILCNLDSDILLKPYWLFALLRIHQMHPKTVTSGFNCQPHAIHENMRFPEAGYNLKTACGGINMLFDRTIYKQFVYPAFDDKLYWDWKVCDNLAKVEQWIPVTCPSVIQHTGKNSTLGKPAQEAAEAKDFNEPDGYWDAIVFEQQVQQQEEVVAPRAEVKKVVKAEYDMDVIILSWAKNQEFYDTTQKAINTLHKSEKDLKFNVIVIESNDKSEKFKDATTIYFHQKEFNYNRAVNEGMSHTSGAPYIAVCNNDLVFTKGWASELIHHMTQNQISSACPIAPGFRGQKEFENADSPIEGYEVTRHFGGWCFVLTREVLRRIGKLSESVRFWYSDNVYVDQLKAAGIRHILVPTSKVIHEESKTLYRGGLEPADINELTNGQRALYDNQRTAKPVVPVPEVLKSTDAGFPETFAEKNLVDQNAAIKNAAASMAPIIGVDYYHCSHKGTGKKAYKHSGNIGDLICSLPVIKATSDQATLLLNINPEDQQKIGSSMPEKYARALMPLLQVQPYIDNVEFYVSGAPVDFDLDKFRERFRAGTRILPHAHLEAFSLPTEIAKEQWLFLPQQGDVQTNFAIINRTIRYRANGAQGWINLFRDFHPSQISFIGLEDEFADFKLQFSRPIQYIKTMDFLQVAHIINASELFVGNGSVCYCIAEGLKHKRWLEADAANDTISALNDIMVWY